MKRSTDEIRANQHQLLALLSEHGDIRVADLATMLGWAPSTLRRHLLDMENHGLIKRKHGLVINNGGLLLEEHFDQARNRNLAEKARIAQHASLLVVPNTSMVLGGGTTCRELALILAREARGNVIVTPSLEIAMILSNNPRIQVRIPSGSVNYRTRYVMGPEVRSFFESCFAQTAILGCDALTPQLTISTVNEMEAEIDRNIVKNSMRVILITDSGKLGHSSMTKICDATEIDMLITDSSARPEMVTQLTCAGVEVRRV